MILKREIAQKAESAKVPKSTIDKDWVLGHFIDGLFSIPELRDNLVFKGGTCLRKCYFPDFRFSEDLDFTCSDPKFRLTRNTLDRVVEIMAKRTELPLHIEELTPLLFNDALTGYQAIVKFWGADHSRNQVPPSPERWTTSVKIEVILYEQMYFPVENRKVFHPYSDGLSQMPLFVPCYSIHEVLSEKLRALIQRSYTAPRDYYDIWYLFNHVSDIDREQVRTAFYQKMKFKGLEFEGVEQLIDDKRDKQLKAAWTNSLAHQIPDARLRDYEGVKDELLGIFQEVFKSENH